MAAVNPVLLDPVAQRLVAEPELAGDLVDRPARRPYQRDRVTLELRAVLGWTSHPSPLPLDLVQCRGVHPPGGTSKRRGRRPDSARPRPHAPARAVRRPWLPGRGPADELTEDQVEQSQRFHGWRSSRTSDTGAKPQVNATREILGTHTVAATLDAAASTISPALPPTPLVPVA